MNKKRLTLDVRVALLYLFFGGLWIVFLAVVVSDLAALTTLQTYKGWAFVVVSALLIFALLRREMTLRQSAEAQAQQGEEYFRLLFEDNRDVMLLIEPQSGKIRNANHAAEKFYGYALEQLCRMSIADLAQTFPVEGQPAPAVARHRLANGEIRTVEVYSTSLTLAGERMLFSIVHDITERERAEKLIEGERQAFEMIAKGEPLSVILEAIVRNIEHTIEGLYCTILLLDPDGVHIRHGAAPSMAESYIRAIDGMPIGPNAGSCGTAAYRRQPVYVSDIASDPLWSDYRDLALAHGLRACWSIPFMNKEGVVLGTFAMYYREPRVPAESDIRLIEHAAQLTKIAIERKRDEEELRLHRDRLAELSRKLLEAQESERRAIGRELHDQFGQLLTALKLTLETAALLPAHAAQAKLTQALELTSDLLSRTSRLSLDLRPPMLDDFGLVPALLWHINRFEEQSGIHVTFTHYDVQGRRFNPEIETAVPHRSRSAHQCCASRRGKKHTPRTPRCRWRTDHRNRRRRKGFRAPSGAGKAARSEQYARTGATGGRVV